MRQSQIFGNGRAHSTRSFCSTNVCATQKPLMSFVLEQGETQPHLEALLIGNLHLPTSIGRPSVFTFSLQITYSTENLAKRYFVFYSAKNSLSVGLWIPPWDAGHKDSHLRSRIFLLPLSFFRIFTFTLSLSQLTAKNFQFLMSHNHQYRASHPDHQWT